MTTLPSRASNPRAYLYQDMSNCCSHAVGRLASATPRRAMRLMCRIHQPLLHPYIPHLLLRRRRQRRRAYSEPLLVYLTMSRIRRIYFIVTCAKTASVARIVGCALATRGGGTRRRPPRWHSAGSVPCRAWLPRLLTRGNLTGADVLPPQKSASTQFSLG